MHTPLQRALAGFIVLSILLSSCAPGGAVAVHEVAEPLFVPFMTAFVYDFIPSDAGEFVLLEPQLVATEHIDDAAMLGMFNHYSPDGELLSLAQYHLNALDLVRLGELLETPQLEALRWALDVHIEDGLLTYAECAQVAAQADVDGDGLLVEEELFPFLESLGLAGEDIDAITNALGDQGVIFDIASGEFPGFNRLDDSILDEVFVPLPGEGYAVERDGDGIIDLFGADEALIPQDGTCDFDQDGAFDLQELNDCPLRDAPFAPYSPFGEDEEGQLQLDLEKMLDEMGVRQEIERDLARARAHYLRNLTALTGLFYADLVGVEAQAIHAKMLQEKIEHYEELARFLFLSYVAVPLATYSTIKVLGTTARWLSSVKLVTYAKYLTPSQRFLRVVAKTEQVIVDSLRAGESLRQAIPYVESTVSTLVGAAMIPLPAVANRQVNQANVDFLISDEQFKARFQGLNPQRLNQLLGLRKSQRALFEQRVKEEAERFASEQFEAYTPNDDLPADRTPPDPAVLRGADLPNTLRLVGSLHTRHDRHDVHAIYLRPGEKLTATLRVGHSNEYKRYVTIYTYTPNDSSVNAPPAYGAPVADSGRKLTFGVTGEQGVTFYLDVRVVGEPPIEWLDYNILVNYH